MSDSYDFEFYIPGDMVVDRLEINLDRQRDIKQYLSQQLKELPRMLTQIGAVDLRDLVNELLEMRMVTDKCIRLAKSSAGAVNEAAGQAAKAMSLVNESEKVESALADAVTIIKNQIEFFRDDADTIRTVLEVVEPDVFMAAFYQLKPSRQAALTGASLEDQEPEAEDEHTDQ